VLMY